MPLPWGSDAPALFQALQGDRHQIAGEIGSESTGVSRVVCDDAPHDLDRRRSLER